LTRDRLGLEFLKDAEARAAGQALLGSVRENPNDAKPLLGRVDGGFRRIDDQTRADRHAPLLVAAEEPPLGV
jgi:hypothetical protein